jgi:NAD(P) transhydrogenase subunit alpha
MKIGVPKESAPEERRVAATPESVKKLRNLGFEIGVARGAGSDAGYADDDYVAAGAEIIEQAAALGEADVVLKIRPPSPEEADQLREGSLLISLLQPERNPDLLPHIVARKASALALERIPRISRAQKLDVLSSMGNLSGYRAIIEAAGQLQGFFGPQVTAAGSTPPAKVLVIGAGVAGLAAVGAARALGAEVRAFDTRAAAREQVESLGAKFLEVEFKESGEGQGGYAKVMSPEFIAAEMALFRAQAKEVDVIVTTALVPGAKAPTLVPRDVVECLKRGSVIIDLAAEQGGNCELTEPGKVAEHNGVKIVGFTDLTSRMAWVASRFFANNLVNLLSDMGGAEKWRIDLNDEVVRSALLVHLGEALPPPAKKVEPTPAKEPAPPKPVKPPSADAKPKQQAVMSPTRRAWGQTALGFGATAFVFVLGRFVPQQFLQHVTVFVLACFVGWQVIWSVSPSLHTPLMSVTNAISGIIVIGGMLQVSAQPTSLASILGVVAVLLASINICGGFLVTQRMLKMFHREGGSR